MNTKRVMPKPGVTALLLTAIFMIAVSCDQSSLPTGSEAIENDITTLGSSLSGELGNELPEGMIYNEYNRNYYQAVEAAEGITWGEANTAAQGLRYKQCKSHLATLTSQNENDWVAANFPQAIAGGYWLGGSQDDGATEAGEGWGWVTGENWLFTNWAGDEPNDFDGKVEESLHFSPLVYGNGNGTWNDQNSNDIGFPDGLGGFIYSVEGYLVEYECPTRVTGGGNDGGHLAFVAIKDANASVKGQASVEFTGGTKIHLEVTCQSLWGNEAWAGGVTTKSNNPDFPEGLEYWWRVVDNGEGANDDPDQLGFFFYSAAGNPIAKNCALQLDGGNAGVLFSWENGNFQVH